MMFGTLIFYNSKCFDFDTFPQGIQNKKHRKKVNFLKAWKCQKIEVPYGIPSEKNKFFLTN